MRVLHVGHLTDAAATTVWSLVLNVLLGVYLAIAFRRVYATGRGRAAVSAVVATFASFMILVAYRALLFFVAFYSM